MIIDYRSFMKYCKNLKGRTLNTTNQVSFLVLSVRGNSLEYFIPSTCARDIIRAKNIQHILHRYELSGSMSICQYAGLVYATYILTLLELYVKQQTLQKSLTIGG